MFLSSIIVLNAISASLSYDIELEGVMKVGQDFLNSLGQDNEFLKKLKSPNLLSESKQKLTKKTVAEAVMRANLETHTSKLKQKPLQDYVDHLKKTGKRSLTYVGKLILHKMNIYKNITFILNALIDDYKTMMQNYHDFVTRENTEQLNVNKELEYLDMLETSCRMLHSGQRKLLDDILTNLNPTSQYNNDSVQLVNELIYEHNVNDKKKEIKYICNTYSVCRQYPGFTDYCADFISEILKLNDKKFKQFLEILRNIMEGNNVFFETLSEKQDRFLIASKLDSISDDLYGMRELFAVMRSVLTHRFKAVQSDNKQLKTRTTAMRILLDIIDKSLSTENELLAMDFDTTVTALRKWSGGIRKAIDDLFEEFVKHVFRTIDKNLTKNAKQETKVLIQIIMRGSTSENEIDKQLFNFGSKYVNGQDFDAVLQMF